jgi:hypothetical protein
MLGFLSIHNSTSFIIIGASALSYSFAAAKYLSKKSNHCWKAAMGKIIMARSEVKAIGNCWINFS